jgi:hypothetical protein
MFRKKIIKKSPLTIGGLFLKSIVIAIYSIPVVCPDSGRGMHHGKWRIGVRGMDGSISAACIVFRLRRYVFSTTVVIVLCGMEI